LTYAGRQGSLDLPVPFRAGQILSYSTCFTIAKDYPRGKCTVSVSAKGGGGDTASRGVSLTIS
jgi:hypothetical protein